MQVNSTSYSHQVSTLQQQNQRKTDEFLFEENNKKHAQIVSVQANIANPAESATAPTIIGALLSTFADEIINLLGGEGPEYFEGADTEESPDNKVSPTAGTTNFVA